MRGVEVLEVPAQGELVSAWVSTARGIDLSEPVTWNMHQAFEVEVILRGRQERRSGHSSRLLVPGDLTLTPGWEPHGFRPLSADVMVLVILFVPAFLGDEMLGDVPWFAPFAAPFPDRPRPANAAMRRQVLDVGTELAREADREGPQSAAWHTSIRLGLLRLLFIVSQRWQPPVPGAHNRTHVSDLARLAPAMGLVSARPEQRVGLAEAAAACTLSASRFGAIFRRSMGMSFARFARHSRLAHVARLLLGTDVPVHVIAEQTGFSNASHLHRAFAKCYGCTPADFRRGAGAATRRRPVLRGSVPERET